MLILLLNKLLEAHLCPKVHFPVSPTFSTHCENLTTYNCTFLGKWILSFQQLIKYKWSFDLQSICFYLEGQTPGPQIFSKSIFPVTQERPRLHESEHESTLLKSQNLHWLGNSLAAQWLGLVTLTMVAQVQFLVRELRFHKLCSTAPQNKNKTKNTLYCFEVSPSLSQRGRINTGDEGHGAEVED